MICPKCNSKLKCFNTRQLDQSIRYREYACIKCDLVYETDEKFFGKIIPRKVPKRLKKK